MLSRSSVLIIPSLNPDEKLLPYIKGLAANGFRKIILVDDGSSPQYKPVFEAAGSLPECDLLVHTVNMGKGRALKDAFNFYCQKYADQFLGVITVDADGQHTIPDVVKLDAALQEAPETLVLGVRDFDDPSVPLKSKFGNKMTKYIMRMLIGSARRNDSARHTKAISDTQTGMRAIPNRCIKKYLTLEGERFEYETNMLIEALHTHTPILEVAICTVYMDQNSGTHFRPLADSLAIYRLIFSTFFKYMLASLSAFFIDYSIYSMFIFVTGMLPLSARIWCATAAARVVSSIYNYTVNMTVVFKNSRTPKRTFVKYYMLCMLQFCCSACFVWLLCRTSHCSELSAKLLVDTVLFLASYQLQKNWVFREDESA